jgi:ribosomal protein S3AE
LIKSIDTSKLDEIRELISQMIDPKQQEFTFEELVQNYDYPNVDLSEIDADCY